MVLHTWAYVDLEQTNFDLEKATVFIDFLSDMIEFNNLPAWWYGDVDMVTFCLQQDSQSIASNINLTYFYFRTLSLFVSFYDVFVLFLL